MKTKTAEQILHKYFHHFKSERTRDLIVKAMEEYRQQPYASQPMSAGQYTLDNGMGTATVMSAEQYSSGAIHSIGEFPAPAMSAEQVEAVDVIKGFLDSFRNATMNDRQKDAYNDAVLFLQDQHFTAPTVKADGWVSVEDKLPEVLETVWVSNGKGWTALGCRTDYYENDEGGFDWCWAGSNGIIYEESGKIVSECEEDDLDVRFWHPLPEPPATK